MEFPTKYSEIIARIERIDPIQYASTRNYLDGAVTYLSPYISRGVISTKIVLDMVLAKGYGLEEMESFVKELAWRDYFQRVGQVRNLDKEIKFPQDEVEHYEIPLAVVNAQTGIEALDQAIEQALRIGAKKTYFTHISHRLGLHDEVEKELPEGIFLAYDGLKLSV